MTQVDPAIWAAIAGGLLGWFLSAVSAGVRSRLERRKALRIMVSLLLPAYVRLEVLINAIDASMSGTESWEAFEEYRSSMFTRHTKFFDRDAAALELAIDQVASFEPLLAVDIRNEIHLLEKSVSTHKLSGTLNASTEAYLKLLAASQVALDGQKELLLKLLRRTSFAAGFIQRVKLWWYLRNRGGGKELREKNQAFIGRLFEDVHSQVHSPKPVAGKGD